MSCNCLGCVVLLCFVVCLTLLAYFFLPSSSLINTYMYMYRVKLHLIMRPVSLSILPSPPLSLSPCAAHREKPLSLYVFTEDQSLLHQVTRRTSSGGLTHNDTMQQYAGTLYIYYIQYIILYYVLYKYAGTLYIYYIQYIILHYILYKYAGTLYIYYIQYIILHYILYKYAGTLYIYYIQYIY